MLNDTFNQSDGVVANGRLSLSDPTFKHATGRYRPLVSLKKDVECPFSGLGAGSHQMLS